MIHFRDRHDVIDWAMNNLPKSYRTIARSFEEGQVEFLGGFRDFPFPDIMVVTSDLPGWIIKITSKFNKIYHVFIYYLNHEPQLLIFNERQIQWKYWDGDSTDNPMYQGDHPEIYKELKDTAIKNE